MSFTPARLSQNLLTVLLSLSVLTVTPVALALDRTELCQMTNPRAIERMASLPQNMYSAWWPEFYEVGSGANREIYAGIMCSTSINRIQNGGNCIVDLRTGRITPAPGWYDGQWVKDPEAEPIFTIPNKFSSNRGEAPPGLTFYRYSDVLGRGRSATPAFRDPGFGNHYHSFGLLERGVTADGRRFAINRAMNDKWGVSIKDYRFWLGAGGELLSIEALGPERNLTNGPGDVDVPRVQPAHTSDANSHASYFDLPMISREARLFAANNRKTMTTQIYSIEDSGKRLVADIGFETGKVSFAPVRRPAPGQPLEVRIAFHVDQIDPAEGDKMTGVHGAMTKDVLTMQLREGRDAQGRFILIPGAIARVTAADRVGDGNYYPKWINEHELIYVESRDRNRQTFIKVDVDLIQMQPNLTARPGEGAPDARSTLSMAALGSALAHECTGFGNQLTARESVLYGAGLTRSKCRALAASWDSRRDRPTVGGEFFRLRTPKAPGTQRVGGWGFAESYARRGAERFEQAPDPQDFAALTARDLSAVCEMLVD